jgi:hypothetical protein
MADSTSPPPPKAKADGDWEGYENDFRGRVLAEVMQCAASPPTDASVLQDRLVSPHITSGAWQSNTPAYRTHIMN